MHRIFLIFTASPSDLRLAQQLGLPAIKLDQPNFLKYLSNSPRQLAVDSAITLLGLLLLLAEFLILPRN